MSEAPYRPRNRPPLDPDATLDMPDREWRRLVLSRIADTDGEISENTAYTMDTRSDVAAVRATVRELGAQLAPVLAWTEQVRVGLKVIGYFGTACEWLVRKWMAVAVLIVIGRLIWTGGWEQAAKLWTELVSK